MWNACAVCTLHGETQRIITKIKIINKIEHKNFDWRPQEGNERKMPAAMSNVHEAASHNLLTIFDKFTDCRQFEYLPLSITVHNVKIDKR